MPRKHTTGAPTEAHAAKREGGTRSLGVHGYFVVAKVRAYTRGRLRDAPGLHSIHTDRASAEKCAEETHGTAFAVAMLGSADPETFLAELRERLQPPVK